MSIVITKDEDGGLSSEVSNRLDELFSDEDSVVSQKSSARPKSAAAADAAARELKRQDKSGSATGVTDTNKDSPINTLKALVFAIDWEITDESMVSFLREIKRLQQKYQNDKVFSLFLKLHESIGKYIKARKAKAHPDSFKFVASVYKNFEKALMTPGISEIQKKKLLATEVNKFKEFKQRVLLREGAVDQAEVVVIDDAAVQRVEERIVDKVPVLSAVGLDSKEALDYIIEELKKTIKAEFHTLRQLIKNLGV
jgi:hypothetical protein